MNTITIIALACFLLAFVAGIVALIYAYLMAPDNPGPPRDPYFVHILEERVNSDEIPEWLDELFEWLDMETGINDMDDDS